MFAIVKELCSFIPRRPAFAFGFSGKAVFLQEVFFSIKRASLSGEIEVKDFVSIKSFFLKQYWVNKDWIPTWLGKGMQAKPALNIKEELEASARLDANTKLEKVAKDGLRSE